MPLKLEFISVEAPADTVVPPISVSFFQDLLKPHKNVQLNLQRTSLLSHSYFLPSLEISFANEEEAVTLLSATDLGPTLLSVRNPINEYESFQHTLCRIYIIPNHLDYLQLLTQQRFKTTSQTLEDYINPEILEFYLIISFGSEQFSDDHLFQAVKQRFGLHCFHLFLCNQQHGDQSALSLYQALKINPPSWISNDDLKNLKTFLKELLKQSLIPHMERQMFLWNDQFVSKRKGAVNTLFQFGRRYVPLGTGSGKSSNARPSTIPSPFDSHKVIQILIYHHSTPESIMKRLADYAFLLQDYKFAHMVYEIVKKDFLNDKSFRQYAATQQMIGLCIILNQEKKDIEPFYESAFNTFLDQSCIQDAMKTSLLFANLCLMNQQYKEAAKILLKIAESATTEQSAILYEEAAKCHLKFPRLQLRKYSFYLMLASSQYTNAQKSEEAVRSLLLVEKYFEIKPNWHLIWDAICVALGTQYVNRKDWANAQLWFTKLLRQSNSSPSSQEQYMNKLINTFHNHFPSAPLQMEIPLLQPINILADIANNSNLIKMATEINQQNDLIWSQMEKEAASLGPLIHGGFSVHGIFYFYSIEPLLFSCNICNPMSIPIQLSSFQLICSWKSDSDSLNILKEDDQFYYYSDLKVEKLPALKLEPNSSEQIIFRLLPEKSDQLRFHKIEFVIQNIIPVQKTLEKKFECDIFPPIPLLDASLLSMPSQLFSGQLVTISLHLKNYGKKKINELYLSVSHSGFFSFESLIPNEAEEIESFTFENSLRIQKMIKLDLERGIEPGEEKTIQGHFRGDKIGSHCFKLLLLYRSQPEPNFRTYKISADVNVVPSLKINAFSRSSARLLDQFILGLEIENPTQLPLKIQQISSLSSQWKLLLLDEDSIQNQILKPGQTLFTYFKIFSIESNAKKSNAGKEWTSNMLEKFIKGEKNFHAPPSISIYASNVLIQTDQLMISCTQPSTLNLTLSSKYQPRINRLESIFSGVPSSHMHQLFTLFAEDELDLITFWSMENETESIKGFHYIFGIQLGPQQPPWIPSLQWKQQKSLFERTHQEKKNLVASLLKNKYIKEVCPVKVLVKANEQWKIQNYELVSVPVFFSFFNESWKKLIRYRIEFLSQQDFQWSINEQCFGFLEPQQNLELEFSVQFLKEGVYDINRWRIVFEVVTSKEDLKPQQTFISQPNGNQWMKKEWLKNYHDSSLLARETLPLLLDKDRAQKLSLPTEKYDLQIQENINKIKNIKLKLETDLGQMEEQATETSEDLEKMESQLVQLDKQLHQIENRFFPTDRKLTGITKQQKPVKQQEESHPLESMGDNQVLQFQNQIIQQQDGQLTQLSELISKHKEMGLAISDELDLQADLLDRAEMGIDETQNRLSAARRRLDQVAKEAKNKKFTIIICCLIFVLILLIILTKR